MTLDAERALELSRGVRSTGQQDTPAENLRELCFAASRRELTEVLDELEHAASLVRALWRERVVDDLHELLF